MVECELTLPRSVMIFSRVLAFVELLKMAVGLPLLAKFQSRLDRKFTEPRRPTDVLRGKLPVRPQVPCAF